MGWYINHIFIIPRSMGLIWINWVISNINYPININYINWMISNINSYSSITWWTSPSSSAQVAEEIIDSVDPDEATKFNAHVTRLGSRVPLINPVVHHDFRCFRMIFPTKMAEIQWFIMIFPYEHDLNDNKRVYGPCSDTPWIAERSDSQHTHKYRGSNKSWRVNQ